MLIINDMDIEAHKPVDFAAALQQLLPPGDAWNWPENGVGNQILIGCGTETSRLEYEINTVLNSAVAQHQLRSTDKNIQRYFEIANKAVEGVSEAQRTMCSIGSKVGKRLWSHNVSQANFYVPLLEIDHLFAPSKIGNRVGCRLWSSLGRYVLRVRYYRSVVNPYAIRDALKQFKQAHVWLWFEDITGEGGGIDAQN